MTGAVDAQWADARCNLPTPVQKVVQVTQGYTARSLEFHWLAEYNGLEVIEKAGTALAHDQDHILRTPYDNAVLVMPTRSKRFSVGNTMLRFGRIEALN